VGLVVSSEDLLYVVAEAIGTEARAVFNNASKYGDFGLMKGISCFSPFINILRHPLWGRVQVCLCLSPPEWQQLQFIGC